MNIRRIVILAIFFLIVPPVYAGISVNPGYIETVAEREKEAISTVTVKNNGDLLSIIDVKAVNFSNEDGAPSAWLSVEPQEFELKPGETKIVKCRIKAPKEAAGELRARLFISGRDTEKGSFVGVRFNMPIYAAIQDTVQFKVDIKDIIVEYKKDKVEGTVILENKSNVHIRPDVGIVIKDINKNLIHSFKIPLGQPAQRSQTRAFMFEEKIGLNPGIYVISSSVDYGIYYGQKDFVVSKEKEFEVKKDAEEEIK